MSPDFGCLATSLHRFLGISGSNGEVNKEA